MQLKPTVMSRFISIPEYAIILFFILITPCFAFSQMLSETMHITGVGAKTDAHYADIDGDGRIDVIACNYDYRGITWWKNEGQGEFSFPISIDAGLTNTWRCESIRATDLDNDGDEDILVLTYSNQIAWYENDGYGSFNRHNIVQNGNNHIRSADLDNDGDQDVVVAGPMIQWLENLGNGTFSGLMEISSMNLSPRDLQLVDMDGDGDTDVVACGQSDNLFWHENLGNGQFGDELYISTAVLDILTLHVVDLNGDGFMDVVTGTDDEDYVSWFQNFGDEQFSQELVIYEAPNGITDVITSDLDDDGDQDVIAISKSNDNVLWFENQGNGAFSSPIVISDKANNTDSEVLVFDVDQDDDLDIISLTNTDGKIAWYENDGNTNFSGEQIITQNIRSPYRIRVADLNNDGGSDVISSDTDDNDIVWYEYLGDDRFGPEQLITDAYEAKAIEVEDVDGDGDNDVIAAIFANSIIVWFQNNGNGTFSSEIVITNEASLPEDIHFEDLDSDGDLDLISASKGDNKIAWYQNDGSGNFSDQIVLSQNALEAVAVSSSDIDGDGLIDILSSSKENGEVAWYKNLGSGLFSSGNVVTDQAQNIAFVSGGDIDGDGDTDILSGSDDDNRLIWYENIDNDQFSEHVIRSYQNYIPAHAILSDADLDGDLDVLVSQANQGVRILYNSGLGFFDESSNSFISGTTGIPEVLAVDFENDGDADFFWAHRGLDRLSWRKNLGVLGCTDPGACNFDETSTEDNGNCCYGICGCTSPNGLNFNPNAECNDGSCVFEFVGTVFYDENENGFWDEDEIPLAFQEVQLNPFNWTTWTNNEGQFSFSATEGVYLAELINSITFPVNTTANPIYIQVNEGTNSVLFGISDEEPLFDIEVDFYTSTFGYPCDRLSNHNICFRNLGNVPIDGVVEVEFSPLFQSYEEVTPIDSINGNILYMSFENLPPGEMLFYNVKFFTPTVDFFGEFLTSTARIYGYHNDDEVAFGEKEITREMTCAYDPNDKQVIPPGYEEPHFILNDTQLEYLVRFQNTGNAPATNVLITDTLDENLNLETFALMANSHSVQTTIKPETRVVEFFFENIMLPDSTNNEPESHGLVSFMITPYTALDPGTELNNTANIYFDNNPPIITNTTWNTIYECTDELASVENVPESLCAGEEFSLENIQPYIETYTWSSGITELGTESILETSLEEGLQVVLLEVENPLCVATNTMTIDVLDSPEIITSGDAVICDQSEEVLLTATSEFPVTWEGLGTENQYSVSPTETTTYYVQSSNDFGCAREESVTVTVSERPEITVSDDAEICLGDEIQISASTEVPFEWIDLGIESEQTVSPTETEEYIAVATNEDGCETEASVLITVNPVPQAQAGEDIEICIGESVDLTASGGDTYQWINFDAGPIISVTPEMPTTYEVVVQNEFGCVDADELLVEVNPLPAIEITENTSICLGETTIISASSDAEIEWLGLGSGDAFSVAPSQSQEYTSVATNEDGCETQATVLITVNPLPLADAGEDLEICSGETIELTATGGEVYQWTGFNEGPTIVTIPNQDTVYEVTVANEFNCSDTDEVTVQVNEYPDTPEITITGNDLLSDPAESYQWYLNGEAIDGAIDQEYIIEEDGDYAVEVTNEFGCSTLSDEQSLVFVGLEELSRWNDLKIYPNPASDIVVIETGMNHGIIEIYDASGRLVLSETLNQSKMQLDVSGFSVGVYQVLLRSAKGHSTTRVSISK